MLPTGTITFCFTDRTEDRGLRSETANEVAALHQRASAWYEQAGLIGEAVRYAYLVHDSERAADLIERHAMAMLLASSDVLHRLGQGSRATQQPIAPHVNVHV